jgi:hypothetical protein
MNWDEVEKAAEELGIPYFTRKKWRQRDHVPYKWRHDIMVLSKGKITHEDFLQLDKRKRLMVA